MNVVLVMVISADGKSTMWHEPKIHGWSSEDRKHFTETKSRHRVLVMGRRTYEAVRASLKLSPSLRRIVLTRNSATHRNDTVAGQLEFTDETPAQLVRRLESEGYTDVLLAGGSEVNKSFLSEGLISECILTVEPRFFGSGNSIFADLTVDIPLTLLEISRLNTEGTIVLHYRVDYGHTTD